MARTQPMFEIRGFKGKNNVPDPARVLPSDGVSFLSECRDTDVTDDMMPHRRTGFSSPSFPGILVHSLWSNGEVCLFIQGSDLKRLNLDYTAQTIFPGAGPSRMVYVDVNGKIYLTNGATIGYFREGAFNDFPDPQQSYKSPMVPGHLIEYFNGRLYVGRDNEIWFSDPMALMRTDRRRNFKQLPSRVTLLSAVDDGVYVSDQERTYFMAGGDPGEAALMNKADYPAIPYTAQKIEAERIGELGLSGPAILWASRMGICLGASGGQFRNLTEDYYRIQGDLSSGSSLLRKRGDSHQYLVSLRGV